MRGKFGIEGMDTLDDEDVGGVEFQVLATLFALPFLEIILGQFHLLSCEKRVELLIEQRDIEGIETLEVVVALSVSRGVVTVDEIVVERHHHRSAAVAHQLYGQSFAGGSLATRRRSGNQYDTHAVALCDILGNLSNLLLLQGLRDVDDSRRVTLRHRHVEVAHRTDAQDVLPLVMLLEDAEHLVLHNHLAQL